MSNFPQYSNRYCNSDDFTARVKQLLSEAVPDSYALVSLDFDNFNYINDLFGYDIGDKTLARITAHLCDWIEPGELFARLHADHFVLWLRCSQAQSIVQRLRAMLELRGVLDGLIPSHYNLVCCGGIAYASDPSESLPGLQDKANFARKLAKGNHTNTFLYYDKHLDEDLQWRKGITLTMESGLQNHEFEMYLQPKILIRTGQIVGAEALARWNSPEHGMIRPDRFIPIFEQNGFIRHLDFFMLEQVCQFLRSSTDEGIPPLPISVNFSKMHIRTANFVERVFRTVSEYNLPTKLIEIEFTESVFSESFEALAQVTGALKYLGFRVSLDDFGSAYSSLNSLKDLPLDVVKIDKAFLSSSSNTEKGRLIVAKIVELVKSLRLVPVMEGVETEEQVQFLQKLSCDLGQGYYYAKPMPADEYRALLVRGPLISPGDTQILAPQSNSDAEYLHVIPEEFKMDNWELYTLGKSINMGLIKGYLDIESNVQYINDTALDYFGYTRQEFREQFGNSIVAFTHPDDRELLQASLQRLVKTGQPIAFKIHSVRKDGKIISLHGRSSCVMDNNGRPIGLHAFQDVTDDLERTVALELNLKDKIFALESSVAALRDSREALRISEERYRLIVEQSDDITFDWDFSSDLFSVSEKYAKLFGRDAIRSRFSQNPELRERIHPEDLPLFEEWIRRVYRQPNCVQSEFRFQTATGDYLWIRVRSTPILDQNGRSLRAVGVLCNINEEKRELDAFKRKSQLDPLTKLFNKEETHRRIRAQLERDPACQAAFFIIDVDNFKGVNDTLGHQLGDTLLVETTQKIRQLFREEDIVGRIGGDEFAVFTSGLSSEDALTQRAEHLVSTLRNIYFGPTSRYAITVSVGIACCPQHGTTMEELYHNADVALYACKGRGKNGYTVYAPHLTMETCGTDDMRTPVERKDRFLGRYFENDYTYNVFQMLYETKDTAATIQKILEMFGRRFGVDRVYIFQHSEDATTTSNTFEWCAPGTPSVKNTLQDLSVDALSAYFALYDEEGILCCNEADSLSDPVARALFRQQNVSSILQCALITGARITGMLGFDVCGRTREWQGNEIATLGYLARILSVFLMKNRITQDLLSSYNNYVELLGNLNGYVYVIDCDTHELLYLNKATSQLGLRIGRPCYAEAFRIDEPCENCPLKKITPDRPFASSEIYSEHLNAWVDSAASRLHWTGHHNAALICCTNISAYKGIPSRAQANKDTEA